MHSITQTIAVENEISSITESFFSAFKLGSLLKQSGAYKAKGIPVLGIFRQLFELAFIHKKLFEALRAGGAVFAASPSRQQYHATGPTPTRMIMTAVQTTFPAVGIVLF